jgi:hypothetical protein
MSGSQSWAIRIIPNPNQAPGQPAAVFQSMVTDPATGNLLYPPGLAYAQVNDVVTWGNATSDQHQPWPTEGNTETGAPASNPDPVLYFSDPIDGGQSSTPQWIVPPALSDPTQTLGPAPAPVTVIYYCCKNHRNERGKIEIF